MSGSPASVPGPRGRRSCWAMRVATARGEGRGQEEGAGGDRRKATRHRGKGRGTGSRAPTVAAPARVCCAPRVTAASSSLQTLGAGPPAGHRKRLEARPLWDTAWEGRRGSHGVGEEPWPVREGSPHHGLRHRPPTARPESQLSSPWASRAQGGFRNNQNNGPNNSSPHPWLPTRVQSQGRRGPQAAGCRQSPWHGCEPAGRGDAGHRTPEHVRVHTSHRPWLCPRPQSVSFSVGPRRKGCSAGDRQSAHPQRTRVHTHSHTHVHGRTRPHRQAHTHAQTHSHTPTGGSAVTGLEILR